MVPVTFIEATEGRKLSKTVSVDRTTSYPLVKKITSHTYEIPLAENGEHYSQLSDLLNEHGTRGHAYFRGAFKRRLARQSRKGLTDKNFNHQLLVFDFDGIALEGFENPTMLRWGQPLLTAVAEKILGEFPPVFQTTTYLVRASASTGLKDTFNFHIFFFLNEEMSPRAMKELLRHLNLEVPLLKNQIELTPTGAALSYCLDPCLAENTRITYIAPPEFIAPAQDPFPDTESRQVVVPKHSHSLPTRTLMEGVEPSHIESEHKKTLRNLRKQRGLKPKTEKTTTIRLNDESFRVVTNPDRSIIEVISDEGRYLRCNVNNGNSGAYYIDKERPTVVWNFKGETPFLLEPADSDLYESLVSHLNETTIVPGQDQRPFAFRDMRTDTYYTGFLDGDGVFHEKGCTGKQNLDDFFKDFGTIHPDIIPQMDYMFRPNDPRQVDLKNRFINQYTLPEVYKTKLKNIDEKFHDLPADKMGELQSLTPNIYNILLHVCGDGEPEMGRLVRWLACVVNRRVKTRISWILHGTPGTGKGVLFHLIIKPLIGERYSSQKNLNDVADTFNDWLAEKLFVMVDEFRLADTGQAGRTSSMLKQAITEPMLTVRGMRKAQREEQSYTNFLFCSNADDSMSFPQDDRRFNVAPRQDVKLFEKYPEYKDSLNKLVNKELPYFASFIKSITADLEEVSVVYENAAKKAMYESSQRTTDRFADALQKGELDWFIDFYYSDALSDIEVRTHLDFKKLIEKITTELGGGSFLKPADLRIMYSRCIGKPITAAALGRFLGLHNIRSKFKKINKESQRGYEINFNLETYEVEQILKNVDNSAESNILPFSKS